MFHKSLYTAYITALLILVVCLLPGSSFPTVKVEWMSFDKLVHVIMYVPLTWTLAYGFKEQTKFHKFNERYLLFAFIIATFYGVFIEFLQFALTPDRAAELYDVFADVFGVMLGLLSVKFGERLILLWNRIIRRFTSFLS